MLAAKEPESSNDFNSLSEEIKLGVKYQVKLLPQVVWCDCYGNELERGAASIFSSASLLKQMVKHIQELQEKRKKDLERQYKLLEKQFAKEKEGGFSPSLILNLQPIARYEGYEPSKKARCNLEEINQKAEDELNKLLDDSSIKKETLIKNLVSIENKYKGLPVAKKSKEIREKTEKELAEQKKANIK